MIRSRNCNHTTDDDDDVVENDDEEELSAVDCGYIGNISEFLQNLMGFLVAFIPVFFIGFFKQGLFKKRRQTLSKNNNKGHNNDKKFTSTSRTATKIKGIFCLFFLLILGIRILFYLCFSESQPQPSYRNIPTSSSASTSASSSSSSLSVVVTETEIENQIENQTQSQQYSSNKPTTTTTTIYTLPSSSSSSSSSNDIESQLLNHYERDIDWYQNKCLKDNATSYINNMRKYSGSISMKHYTRGCSTSGLHPITHSNPFHTPTHNCNITTSIDIIRTTTTIDHLYESSESWTIQTYDKQKNLKQIGGDTFYIVYYEDEYENGNPNVTISKPVAVGSKPIDYYNGTYGIENFYQLPFVSASTTKGAVSISKKRQRQHRRRQQQRSKGGKIMVYPISTCFIGELYPPLKDEWNTGGSTGNIRWSTSSTSASTSTSTSTSTADESTSIESSIESRSNNVDNNVVNIVKSPFKIIDPILLSSSNKLMNNDLPNLKQYNRTIFFGDSIMRQMIYNVFTKQYYHQNKDNSQLRQSSDSRIWMGGGKNNAATANTTTIPKSKDPNNDNDDGPINVNMPLSPQTLPDYIKVMEASIQNGLLLPTTPNTTTTTSPEENNDDYKIALVIGSSAWDIIWPTEWQGPTFQNHLQAVTDLLFYIRKKYPHIYLIWKLPYSNAMYNADQNNCFSRNNTIDNDDNGSSSCISALRYSSQERFYSVYQKQKQLLTAEDTTHNFYNDSHISVIDLYDISYLSGIHWMIPNDSIHYLPDWNRQILQLLYR
jgi:hypothetical protein